MPQLLRTPEQVLRETERSLYLIRFHDCDPFCRATDAPAATALISWFRQHLPQVELEELGPSEFSGFIECTIGELLRVDFDGPALALYESQWENEDGSTKDPRWQCYLYRYPDYLTALAQQK